jgi:bifunctional DNA-binding transcriptional regulator/antitoxin component of YhaV-PrlF toxin-antitoxin module
MANGIIGKSKLSVKNQVCVPKAVRMFLYLNSQDRVVWRVQDGKIMMEKEKIEKE